MIKITVKEYEEFKTAKKWHDNYLTRAIEREEWELSYLENHLKELTSSFDEIKKQYATNTEDVLIRIANKRKHIEKLKNNMSKENEEQ